MPAKDVQAHCQRQHPLMRCHLELLLRKPFTFAFMLFAEAPPPQEGEEYVADWVAECTGWPAAVAGNWAGATTLPGRLRLASKSLFFEADDVRVPIVRCNSNCRLPLALY